MAFRKRANRSAFDGLPLRRLPRRRGGLLLGCCLLILLLAALSALHLRSLVRDIAVSDARDAVTMTVNACVARIMREHGYRPDSFVTLEKDLDGCVTAITTDTARVNALSAELLSEIARAADGETLDVRIPFGNLFGSELLMGRGPKIPVEVLMLTSSIVRFDNDLIATGINQSRHVLTLKASVDIDIMIPWSTIRTTVGTDVMIAETIIIGRVPDTYMNITEDRHGSE